MKKSRKQLEVAYWHGGHRYRCSVSSQPATDCNGCDKADHSVFTESLTHKTASDFIYDPDGKDDDETITDGFGMRVSRTCPHCKQKSMSIVRPGKAQCDNCG